MTRADRVWESGPSILGAVPGHDDGGPAEALRAPADQWKESPQAHEPPALGLSIVKPCFEMVSSKSMVAPMR